jgi:hypothetical protein
MTTKSTVLILGASRGLGLAMAWKGPPEILSNTIGATT